MGWSFSIGRLFGSELKVHVTFFILLAWIGLSAYFAAGIGAALDNMIFVVALFACVVAHEFGHALMARRYGIRTPDITLLPIGGLARLDRMPEKPAAEIAVALAGPAVNLVIWGVLTVVFGAKAWLDVSSGDQAAGVTALDQLAMVNLYLMAFNLLPAFPMDGGRVLRALLASQMGRVRGTAVAARIGQIMAVFFGFVGLSIGAPILVLIAAFVFFAANAESADATLSGIAGPRTAGDAMIRTYVTLSPSDPVGKASDAIITTTQHEFPVIDLTGRPAGFLTRQAVFAAVATAQDGVRVDELMTSEVPIVPSDAPLKQALELLTKSPARAVMVIDARGFLLGYITQENLAELVLLNPKG